MRKESFIRGKEREYSSWRAMHTRCLNPNHEAFKRYQANGISICDRWMGPNGFKAFFSDMGPRPEGCSLDRIDNAQGYYPENCRWTTPKKQGNNRGNNCLYTFRGETKTLAEWADFLGIKYTTLHERLRLGKTVEEAFTMQLQRKHFNRAKEARKNGLDPHLVAERIRAGWSEREAVTLPKQKNQQWRKQHPYDSQV